MGLVMDHGHPSFSLTTIICENRLHKQVNNCFSQLTLLVIAVYVEQQYTPFLCTHPSNRIVAVTPPSHPSRPIHEDQLNSRA